MSPFQPLWTRLQSTRLYTAIPDLKQALEDHYYPRLHGNHAQWQLWLEQLPSLPNATCYLDQDQVHVAQDTPLPPQQLAALHQQLAQLQPWRKGPFNLHGVEIDTEWRSDWKWQRLQPHISPLQDRKVLDVGCGNGYHCWRMLGEGANLVLGIDPSQLFLQQFRAVQHFMQQPNIFQLPLTLEQLPASLNSFDTVFSMGVLYHRRSPIDHLLQLAQCLRPGGELILETLVLPEGEGDLLVPEDRYAQMRNVWFIPSTSMLARWLARSRFDNIRLVDVNQTQLEEQRETEWMRFHSLDRFLHPDDHNLTIEGYPAPRRAIMIAQKPE